MQSYRYTKESTIELDRESAELVPDATGVPFAAPGWADIKPVEVVGYSPQCLPLAPPLDHERQYLRLWPVGMMRGQRQRPRRLTSGAALL